MPKLTLTPPIVQVAIDVLTIDDAMRIAEAAVRAGADWLEVGTPLVTFEGVRAIGALARAFPGVPVLADPVFAFAFVFVATSPKKNLLPRACTPWSLTASPGRRLH